MTVPVQAGSGIITPVLKLLLFGDGLLLGSLSVLGLRLLGVTVEEHVDHDVPGLVARNGSAETQHFTGQQVVDQTDGMLSLVVGGDGDIHVDERGVGVTQGNGGNVDVRSLLHGQMIGAWVRHQDQAGLLEGASDVVGEGTRGEASSNGLGTNVVGKLQSRTLTIRTGRDHTDIGRVLNGGDDTSSQHNLFPSLSNVDQVDSIRATSVHIAGHGALQVLGTQVALGGQHLLSGFLSELQASGEFVGHCVFDLR